MKYIIDGILIVEGKTDVAFLSSFIEAEFVTTNGYDINPDEIDFVLRVISTKKVIILSDSDKAGELIRKRLNEKLPNAMNALVDLTKCDKNGKHGVAECLKEEVISVLKPYFTIETPIRGKISLKDLAGLGLTGDSNSKELRRKLCKRLKLGVCNAKNMIKRMNFLGITLQEIKEVIG